MNRLGGIGRAFRSRTYRIYWVGNAASILTYWIYTPALGWFVWQLTHSELWLGLVPFAARIPALVLAPLAGAVADRYGLRRTAAVALSISAMGSVGLFAAAMLGLQNVHWILLFALLQGLTISFELPARQALLPNMLADRDDLSAAIALNSTTFHTGSFIGPSLFALMIQFVDIKIAFLVNGLGFGLFAVIMMMLRIEEEGSAASAGGMWRDVADGFRYVLGHPGIMAILLTMFVTHIVVRSYTDLLPAFADVVFGQGPTGYSFLQSAAGAGALLGGVILAARGRTRGLTRVFLFGLLATYSFYLAFAASGVFAVGVVLIFLLGIMLISVIVSAQTLIQNAVEYRVRGRVIALTTGMAIGVPSLGSLLLGWLATLFGIQAVVIIACIIGILFWLSFAARKVGRQRAVLEAE